MNWKLWLKGLASAIINGAAGGVVLIIVDPKVFNLQAGAGPLGWACLVFAIFGAANYLKQSPLPADKV